MPIGRLMWRILSWPWKIFSALFLGNNITLEVWSNCLNKKEIKEFVRKVKNRIRNQSPNAKILLTAKRSDIESRNCIFLHFDGYEIILSPNIDPWKLKSICRELEINKDGKRISDIDIYYGQEKISRKIAAVLQN